MTSEFFSMNGYGIYIWPAYGVTFAVLAGLLIGTLCSVRRANRA